jgi:hypothetical protein
VQVNHYQLYPDFNEQHPLAAPQQELQGRRMAKNDVMQSLLAASEKVFQLACRSSFGATPSMQAEDGLKTGRQRLFFS